MSMPQYFGSQNIDRIKVRQRFTMLINRYEIYQIDQLGNELGLLCFAEQKRFALKEKVRFFTDETKSTIAFEFAARTIMDFGATYDVFDPQQQPLGLFRKDFTKSLLRSTWHVETADGMVASGQERNLAVAILRRFWDTLPLGEIPVPWQFHFDFRTANGALVMSDTKKLGLRDVYLIDIPLVDGRQLDWRLAAAIGVALDALQSR